MSASKILPRAELAAVRAQMAVEGRRLVLTNGCFDLLHLGHVRYLQAARALGDALAVAVNGDSSVRALKGPTRPLNGEQDRAEVLAALACVDFVTVFPEVRATETLRTVQPHVYAKGGDYTLESLDREEVAALEAAGTEIRLLPLVPGKSTTGLLAAGAQKRPLRLAVLGSGKGSNFRAILEAVEAGKLQAKVWLVISDVEDAGILTLARERGIPAEWLPPGRFRTKLEPAAEETLAEKLRAAEVDYVVLAGYMRMVKAPLLEAFPGRIINIHPSLLPAFPGLEAWAQALAAGVPETGCTVHYVDAGMDTGATIAQRRVPVLAGDTPGTLHARIQVAEHQLLPEVLAGLAKAG